MKSSNDFQNRVTGNFDRTKPDLRVVEIAWSEYQGATEEEIVVYAIESMALRKIPSNIKDKIERIIIDRRPDGGG